jgi:hypothetical protein
MLTDLDTARAAYLWQLQQGPTCLEARLADIYCVLEAVLDDRHAEQQHELICARARYVHRLRADVPTFDERLSDLARVCTRLFYADVIARSSDGVAHSSLPRWRPRLMGLAR